MSDGKRLDSSLGILERHYPRVASLQDYIHSILSNVTEVALVAPNDPEEYRELLENSKVGYHQPPCQNYRGKASMFEIDEVDRSYAQFLHATYERSGHQKITVVPPSPPRFCKKCYYRWLQGTLDLMFPVRFNYPSRRQLERELLSISRSMG
jgi:hypothetical protein